MNVVFAVIGVSVFMQGLIKRGLCISKSIYSTNVVVAIL